MDALLSVEEAARRLGGIRKRGNSCLLSAMSCTSSALVFHYFPPKIAVFYSYFIANFLSLLHSNSRSGKVASMTSRLPHASVFLIFLVVLVCFVIPQVSFVFVSYSTANFPSLLYSKPRSGTVTPTKGFGARTDSVADGAAFDRNLCNWKEDLASIVPRRTFDIQSLPSVGGLCLNREWWGK
jgi:hypothetical protein